jgi:hypothetical protein
METLKTFDRLEIKTDRTEGGIITKLIADAGISAHGNIGWNGKTVLANYVYKEDGTYELVYSMIDSDGNIAGNYLENNGILPTLFLSPDNKLYVSIIPYDPDKELEISIPLLNRASIQEPKRNRPFPGKYIGNVHQSSVFHDIDIFSDKKQDKLLAIEFKNGTIKKKHHIKIDFPKDNIIYIENNEIHLLARDSGGIYIHRQIDEFGKAIKQREINPDSLWCREILSLSFNAPSFGISNKGGKIGLLEIDSKGNYSSKELINIEDRIYNMWKPVKIGNNSFAVQFNTEFANGWFTIHENELSAFYYGKGGKGYKDLTTGKIIDMGNNNLILYGINKTENNNYAVIFYDNVKDGTKNKEIIVFNKKMV